MSAGDGGAAGDSRSRIVKPRLYFRENNICRTIPGDNVELRQIKYFLAIVDNGSVSRAAQRLYIAQSALSKQVSDLEAELDVQLLNRCRSGVFLTESGKIFYEYGQAILKQINDAKEAVRCANDVVVGSVLLAIPQSAALALALPLMNAVQKRFPQITFHINEELTGNLLDHLLHRRVDLAIFTSNMPMPGFSFEAIVREDFHLIGPADSGLDAKAGDLSLQEAIAAPLMLSGSQHAHCIRRIIEDAVAAQGLAEMNIVAEINSVQILKYAVEAGQAKTIMPLALVAQEVAQGRLRARRIRPDQLSRTLGIFSSSSIAATNAKKAIALAVRETILELARSGAWPSLHEVGADDMAFAAGGAKPA
jgi:LysR family nitrogen assimilation transcriptional regulator